MPPFTGFPKARFSRWRKAGNEREKIHSLNQRIFETSLDLILVVDSRGNYLRISPSSVSIIGYHPEEMIGQRSEEHTSELQSLMRISYAVFCLKKKKHHKQKQDKLITEQKYEPKTSQHNSNPG